MFLNENLTVRRICLLWKVHGKIEVKKHGASSLAYIVTYIGSEPKGGTIFDKMHFKRFEIAR